MKPLAFLLVLPLLSACIVHLHVHEAPKPAAASLDPGGATGSTASEPAANVVSGTVLDADGEGVPAHIAAVGQGGSYSTWTDRRGRFALTEVSRPEFTLYARTEDGRIATARSHLGAHDVALVVQPGGTFVIELAGREKARCAIFADGLRFQDFGLQEEMPVRVVVPPGELRVQIYEGDTVLAERHFTAVAGRKDKIRMEPHS